MVLVEEIEPLLFRMTKVPQNAKAVLVEPVLLNMDKFNVLYTESPVVQTLHVVVPGKVALTNVRSFEVHELAEGNVVVVCANDGGVFGLTKFDKVKGAFWLWPAFIRGYVSSGVESDCV